MPIELTYLDFLAVFLAVPLSLLCLGAVVHTPRERPSLTVQVGGIAVIILLALAYTIPWDNYLIAQGVWWYGDGRVAATVWLAPIEEYLFIVLQSVLVAVWTFQVAGPVDESVGHTWRDRGLGALAGAAVAAGGAALFLAGGATYYLGAILAWAGPVLAIQWAVGWRYLLAVRRRVLVGIGAPVVYLCVIDRIALAQGIWTISPDHTTGLGIAGLPIEEATFFLVTSTFVVQGLVLLRWVIARWD